MTAFDGSLPIVKGRNELGIIGLDKVDYIYGALDDIYAPKPMRFGYLELGTVNNAGVFFHYTGWSLWYKGVSVWDPMPRSFVTGDESRWALAYWSIMDMSAFYFGWGY